MSRRNSSSNNKGEGRSPQKQSPLKQSPQQLQHPQSPEELDTSKANTSGSSAGGGSSITNDLRLPVSRVKTIMKSSPDVETVVTDSLQLITKATELFVEKLVEKAYQQSLGSPEIAYHHVAGIVQANRCMDFLKASKCVKSGMRSYSMPSLPRSPDLTLIDFCMVKRSRDRITMVTPDMSERVRHDTDYCIYTFRESNGAHIETNYDIVPHTIMAQEIMEELKRNSSDDDDDTDSESE